jgi:hypothetical protein
VTELKKEGLRTLADFIKAMGGELEIRANFADGGNL